MGRDKTTETAPERIWLQVDTGAMPDERDDTFPTDFEGVTWQDEEIGGVEVEYVRADLVRASMPTNAADPGDPELSRLAALLGMTANTDNTPNPRRNDE